MYAEQKYVQGKTGMGKRKGRDAAADWVGKKTVFSEQPDSAVAPCAPEDEARADANCEGGVTDLCEFVTYVPGRYFLFVSELNFKHRNICRPPAQFYCLSIPMHVQLQVVVEL